jgi:hypothetical protein
MIIFAIWYGPVLSQNNLGDCGQQTGKERNL